MTNQERLQANNAKIEAIQQALENKVATSGEIEIIENGKHDVSKYATANVNVQPNLITATFTENGTYKASNENADGYSSVDVNVPVPDLSQTTATADDVLEGKEFFNASGEKVAGTYKDMLQARVDAAGPQYLFYEYRGDNIDFAKNLDITTAKVNGGTMKYIFGNALFMETIDLSYWDTSKVTDMSFAFFNNSVSTDYLKVVTLGDTSNVTNFQCTFMGRNGLTTVNNLNTAKATNLQSMFASCSSLEYPPEEIDLSNAANMSSIFSNCTNLKTIPKFKNSGLINTMAYAFRACASLETIDLSGLDTHSVLDMQYTFAQNMSDSTVTHTINLTGLDTSRVTRMNNMFQYQDKLETIIGELNMIACTNVGSMFTGCYKLTTVTLKNIKISLTIGSGTTYGHLLTLDSLLNTIKELHTNTGTSTLKLTMGTANTAKLADVYVKLIDITDEMRAEDPYIDNKAPFVVCESTDEGAMLITEYVTTVKKWQLA